jgi:hypothetical protein
MRSGCATCARSGSALRRSRLMIGDEFDLERPPSRNCVEVHAPRLSRGPRAPDGEGREVTRLLANLLAFARHAIRPSVGRDTTGCPAAVRFER